MKSTLDTNHPDFTRTFGTWCMMLQRVLNPKIECHNRYGARGITFCDRWWDFRLFVEDMGWRPEDRTLDRINNDLGYSKENCRWATRQEQAENRSNTIPAGTPCTKCGRERTKPFRKDQFRNLDDKVYCQPCYDHTLKGWKQTAAERRDPDDTPCRECGVLRKDRQFNWAKGICYRCRNRLAARERRRKQKALKERSDLS